VAHGRPLAADGGRTPRTALPSSVGYPTGTATTEQVRPAAARGRRTTGGRRHGPAPAADRCRGGTRDRPRPAPAVPLAGRPRTGSTQPGQWPRAAAGRGPREASASRRLGLARGGAARSTRRAALRERQERRRGSPVSAVSPPRTRDLEHALSVSRTFTHHRGGRGLTPEQGPTVGPPHRSRANLAVPAASPVPRAGDDPTESDKSLSTCPGSADEPADLARTAIAATTVPVWVAMNTRGAGTAASPRRPRSGIGKCRRAGGASPAMVHENLPPGAGRLQRFGPEPGKAPGRGRWTGPIPRRRETVRASAPEVSSSR